MDPIRDIVIGVLVIVVGAAVVAYAGLPTRVALVEASQTDIKKAVDKIDGKLDDVLRRLPRR